MFSESLDNKVVEGNEYDGHQFCELSMRGLKTILVFICYFELRVCGHG